MSKKTATNVIDRVFKDRHGKWAVVQMPNFLLWAWLEVTAMLFFVRDPQFQAHVGLLQNAILFTWAYIELISGSSYFRKALGGVVLAIVTVGFLL